MGRSELESWKWLWRRLARLRKPLLACILLAMLESLTFPPIAWLIRRILDVAIPSKDVRLLVLLGLGIVGCSLASDGLALGTRLLSTRTTKMAIGTMRQLLLQRCFELPRSVHDTLDRGDVHTLFVQDTQLLDVMINESISILTPSAIISALLIALLAAVNVKLLGILVLIGPLLYLVNFRLKSVTMAWAVRARDSFTHFSTGVHFVLQKLDLTRYQTAERAEIRRQGSRIEQLRVDSERMVWLQCAYGQVQSAIVATTGILILVIGGIQVISGRMSLGSLLAFYVIFALLGSNLQKVFGAIPHIITGNQSLCALYSFYSLEAKPPYSGTMQPEFAGSIELSSVSFQYKIRPVFHDLSLRLDRGSVTAIIGPNGGGKTTVARLILGLYKPNEGELLAEGISYEKLDIEQLREGMAFTPQDPVLFGGTIWENVSYGILESDADHVTRACQIALVDDFVRFLPKGYDTEVGEDGGSLSGGQRQKIAIARALARRPHLLILDEPTNHLDQFSARQMLRNLKAMPDRPTLLIITQDDAIARQAQFQYWLENGNLTLQCSDRQCQAETFLAGLAQGDNCK
jgi:ABC-type bacteriocin/lantibiotic exporter with double-glycine peptidase domain